MDASRRPASPDEAWSPADCEDDLAASLREANPAVHHCPEHRRCDLVPLTRGVSQQRTTSTELDSNAHDHPSQGD